MEKLMAPLVEEFITKLESRGYSKEYVDGSLEGMSFAIEALRSLVILEQNKARYIREEHSATRSSEKING